MRTLVLSISFFVLTVSPFTCSSEMSKMADEQQTTTTQQDPEGLVEIDPIVMPKKP
ncbi:hypothetical protein NAT51_10290 [Flavobacterium amniphilum]|uniref:hypothetical protein n=1 Tax=Flavobacterium amniphilum TaxID=1834035 RepID=UPI00202A2672|nr:hypothetical protein [Flavobacterium amniphilum]MCL9805913.1 hypothetical protein [Flavobacterium amniphilum]